MSIKNSRKTAKKLQRRLITLPLGLEYVQPLQVLVPGRVPQRASLYLKSGKMLNVDPDVNFNVGEKMRTCL